MDVSKFRDGWAHFRNSGKRVNVSSKIIDFKLQWSKQDHIYTGNWFWITFEPGHFLQDCLCSKWRLGSACGSTQTDQSSQGARWVAKDSKCLQEDSKVWSNCADAQVYLLWSDCVDALMQSCRKCCALAHSVLIRVHTCHGNCLRNLDVFKARVLSENFMLCEGKNEFYQNVQKISGNFNLKEKKRKKTTKWPGQFS